MRNLAIAANTYVKEQKVEKEHRFDIATVVGVGHQMKRIEHDTIHTKMLGCIFSKIVHIYIVFSVLNHTKKEVIDPMIFCIVSRSEVPMSQKKELHAVFSDLHEVLIYCFLTFRRGIFHNASAKAR